MSHRGSSHRDVFPDAFDGDYTPPTSSLGLAVTPNTSTRTSPGVARLLGSDTQANSAHSSPFKVGIEGEVVAPSTQPTQTGFRTGFSQITPTKDSTTVLSRFVS
jgi:hypothetical protein